MLERLYFSDLILADLFVPHGNVYYEIGVRQGLAVPIYNGEVAIKRISIG
jgi:hypothetical protein